MSIAKLFVKVFGVDIFEQISTTQKQKPEDEDDEAGCSATQDTPKQPKVDEMKLSDQMVIVRNWLNERLNVIESNSTEATKTQRIDMASRLGPEHTICDIDFTSTVRISADRLSLRSQGSFNTIKANVCVYGGRWMYEVLLHSKGVMQIGWCSNKCTFNENSGVGDTKWSYGYDGSKQQIWHISTSKYGDKWQIGDIIGISIDVDNESIEYFRNGNSMGVAFSKLERGPGISFFPAVSLGYNQGIQVNFGNMPFKYPVEGFLPIQAKPIVRLQKADLLLSYLANLATVLAHNSTCKKKDHIEGKISTKKTVYVVFATLLIEKLAQVLFDPYVIEDKLLPHIVNFCTIVKETDKEPDIFPGTPESTLGALLSLLWNYLENEEVKFIMRKLANALLSTYTHTHVGLDYEKQKSAINVFTCLCRHMQTRKTYLEYKFFKKHCLALLMYIRPPEYKFMQQLVPDSIAWTEGIGGPKQKYLSQVDRITKATESLYNVQKNLLILLFTNTDGDELTPSSRKIFISKLRRYVMDLSMEQRPFHSFFLMQSSIMHPIESTVALSFICMLIDATRTLFERELPATQAEIKPDYFFDGTFEYQHFDRVGGVLSHLRKVHRNDITTYLGAERTQVLLQEDRTVMRVGELVDPSMFLTTTNLNNIAVVGPQGPSATFTHFFNPRLNPLPEASPGNCDAESSLSELFDICVLYYYSLGHKYTVKISSVRDEIAALNEVLRETKFYREDVERKLKVLEEHASVCMNENHCNIVTDLKQKFSQRENVFAKRSIELARKQAWYRAVALGKHRRMTIVWFLERTLRTLDACSQLGPLFSFVPEVYINILPILLDTVMDFSHHDLHVQFELSDAECAVNASAEFLGLHSADPRIILASCKDSLLQALGTLTCHKTGVRALEQSPKKSQNALVKSLLRPYENRAWGQSNWLLLRFWLGDGFGYRDSRQPSIWQGGNQPVQIGLCRSRAKNETHTGLLHHIAPANASRHFQKLIGQKLAEDEPLATAFLNSVLSQLNWAFSEFILLLQEIQNTAHRQENAVFEPKQLKICSMCFELTVSLMRCLEMIITIAPEIFQEPTRSNSDLILNRVCQLISQVLSRVTVPPGCFQFIVDMCSSDLNSVTHFPIITAALGILLALLRSELDTDRNPQKVTRLTRALLTDPSFQFANLEFALGEIKTPILQQAEIPRGNFDPQTRAHIDPLTNDVRVPMPSTSTKRIRADPPIIKFALSDYPTHVTPLEIDEVRRLIDMLRLKQSLLSDITLPSEDSLCPICCAKPIAVIFTPCKHQSCSNCIMQHLLNSKVCFYCKTLIKTIETNEGTVIYNNNEYTSAPTFYEI
ncbi:PREDICTED: E3 ubiquitin-protein ligase RNF123 [Rhagoletis zephyria]|uniref:E3 ubiquitin-protein ligase RNF123 n=1 Tax=Rhagoletis zephyria TaxID=28612 RepID=UPI0008119B40|nr:PREDICTED: E3 ubiquitin-protein ligase RNF123 [Rhagoletis zephyria]